MSRTPSFSVIVVCRNPGPQLRSAIASLWSQREVIPDIVVIDGNSNDGTREWLETHRSRFGTLISEPDRGIYHAMNKGIARAAGDWVLFLGADDRLADESVLASVRGKAAGTSSGVLAGLATYEDGRVYRYSRHAHPLARNFAHHQATFYRRSLFDEHGSYDESLRIAGDYDLNLRFWRRGVSFEPIPVQVATCSVGGVSDSGGWRCYGEEIVVRHRYAPAWQCLRWDVFSVVRWTRKQLVRARRS
ncbi:MAG TPA: glycosyltransferase family 2 protein [Opitutus sp.]|nr:glycosyltransferase family 2 protein [Opitutus sp.]